MESLYGTNSRFRGNDIYSNLPNVSLQILVCVWAYTLYEPGAGLALSSLLTVNNF
jgi:hypothetical protein